MNVDLLGQANSEELRRRLLAWGSRNLRTFPWRKTRDPYRVLMAEVMLHRTRVEQVVPVYDRFVRAYPTVCAFAGASRQDLFDLLHPLGLHWRIPLVYEMAQILRRRFRCRVPERFEELTSLPGVSHYIAGAVRCFSWNHPEPLADTNTVRVMGRIFGFATKDSTRRSKWFHQLLRRVVDPVEPRLFNYALLDLAHMICTSTKAPACGRCPLRQMCSYARKPDTKKRTS